MLHAIDLAIGTASFVPTICRRHCGSRIDQHHVLIFTESHHKSVWRRLMAKLAKQFTEQKK